MSDTQIRKTQIESAPFDGTTGHKHTGEVGDAPLISAGIPAGISGITVKEIDGVPSQVDVVTLNVTNGKLSISAPFDGSATLDLSGSVTPPAGSDTFVQFNNGGVFGGVAALAYNKNTAIFTVYTGGTGYLEITGIQSSSGIAMRIGSTYISGTSYNTIISGEAGYGGRALLFQTGNYNGTGNIPLTLLTDGKVGINQRVPTHAFEVNSNDIMLGTLAGLIKGTAGVLGAIAIGTANQILGVNSAGSDFEWKTAVGPAGGNNQIQFNSNGAFGASSLFYIDTTLASLYMDMNLRIIKSLNNLSGSASALTVKGYQGATLSGVFNTRTLDIGSLVNIATDFTDSGLKTGCWVDVMRNETASYGTQGGVSSNEIRGLYVVAGHYNVLHSITPASHIIAGAKIDVFGRIGTIEHLYGIMLNFDNTLTAGDSSTVTDFYGLYLAHNNGGGTVTNNWAIYQASTLQNNYFAGSVRTSLVLSPQIKTDTTAPTDFTITTGAAKTLVLVTPVYEDIQFSISSGKIPASNYPTYETFTANTEEYAFSVDDKIQLEANEPSHGWSEGTLGSAHIHFTIKTLQNSGSNRYAKFEVIFAYSDYNGIWTEQAALFAETTIPNNAAALQSYLLSVGSVTLTGLHLGSQIKARVRRIAATGGTEYAADVYITQVGIHTEKVRMGSRSVSAA